MDRALPQRRWTRWRWPAAGALLLAGLAVVVARAPAPGSTQSVAADRVTIAAVVGGQFVDDLPVRATVLPLTSVYLDAVEGGRVERVLVEDGARVKAGTLLAELSNASLQLEVLSREAQVAEQMNALRAQELNLERNRLDAKLRVAELELRDKQLRDTVEQQR
ncbi:MAG: biotin/lipoyl-binding protein, partial [Burkholderiales bacterium]|nr:biotin/lipoyl-binding protein [Burkholderiales bacterium]